MSTQGLEVIESSTQKTHEWIAGIAEAAHMEKRDAYKALRAVLLTMRDRLPLDNAVHLAAQLPMFLRGLFFEGWEPSKVPIKMSAEEFLQMVQEKIVTDRVIDPLRITQIVLSEMMRHVGPGEMEKVKHCFPADMQTLWPSPPPVL
jgi:uncharacterized protein (DUF2267 family)